MPVVAREIFLPGRAGQAEARIPVYQGESEFQDENHKLGEVVLKDLHVARRGETPIEVVFELSGEGTLSVKRHRPHPGNMRGGPSGGPRRACRRARRRSWARSR